MSSPQAALQSLRVVLDTNAALDWLVFGNVAMRPWGDALSAGLVTWLGCARMRQELAHMVVHPSLARWNPDVALVLGTYDKLCQSVQEPGLVTPHGRLRCSDPDDQVFVDLALAHRARWLLTHDRALLKLARHTAPLGLAVLRPADGRP